MYSGEKEYVLMDGECSCDGPVESWLQNVVDGMKQALQLEFRQSVTAYDEKPRAKWLFDQSAQVTVIVTRVFYTQARLYALALGRGLGALREACPETDAAC